MSDENLKLMCLVWPNDDPNDNIVEANINNNDTVDDLKILIKHKYGHRLRGVDASNLVLWKCSISVNNDLQKTLNTVRFDDTEAQLQLVPVCRISEYFATDLPQKTIHILVEVPALDEPPNKKARLVGPDNKWDYLWLTFWGKLAPECTVESSVHIPSARTLDEADDETKYQYLELPNKGSFPCGLCKILIIKTYKSLYDKLCKEDKAYIELMESEHLFSMLHSTVITGQPGTGKTAGLSCILVWRLQQKKPTVYCGGTSHAYVFTDSGVQRVSLWGGERIKALDESNRCCGLVDINVSLLEVPWQFHPCVERLGRVVVATFPNPEHVTAFKQHDAEIYYTPTWTWGEIYCASLLLGMPMATKKLRDMYEKLGGIPRRCFRAALFPDGEKLEMREITKAVNQIDDIEGLACSVAGAMPFENDASHIIVRIEPMDDEWKDEVTDLLSRYVAGLVYERILLNAIKIRDSIGGLLCFPNTRIWGGKLFEVGVHRTFHEGITFEPVAIDDDAPALSVQIRKAKSEGYDYFHTLSLDEDIFHRYLIPLSSTAETISAVYVSNFVTVLMQITVFPNHDLNLKGITELVDELPLAAKKRICIVFVVPDHKTTARPYERQTIDIPAGVSVDVAEAVVGYNQYVYYFPMSRL